jgi:hypothetical protein
VPLPASTVVLSAVCARNMPQSAPQSRTPQSISDRWLTEINESPSIEALRCFFVAKERVDVVV